MASAGAVRGKSALMFSLPNGACGLAFPKRHAIVHGEEVPEYGPFVSLIGGDYDLARSPLGFVSDSELAKFDHAAEKQTNVIVRKATGRVVMRPKARILAMPEIKFLNYPECTVVSVPGHLTGYGIVSHGVSCVVVRTLIWAWAEDEGKNQNHPRRVIRIIGWRCVGTKPIAHFSPRTYEIVTCARGKEVVQARNELERIGGAPLPTG